MRLYGVVFVILATREAEVLGLFLNDLRQTTSYEPINAKATLRFIIDRDADPS
jgi:hypothetical protein